MGIAEAGFSFRVEMKDKLADRFTASYQGTLTHPNHLMETTPVKQKSGPVGWTGLIPTFPLRISLTEVNKRFDPDKEVMFVESRESIIRVDFWKHCMNSFV